MLTFLYQKRKSHICPLGLRIKKPLTNVTFLQKNRTSSKGMSRKEQHRFQQQIWIESRPAESKEGPQKFEKIRAKTCYGSEEMPCFDGRCRKVDQTVICDQKINQYIFCFREIIWNCLLLPPLRVTIWPLQDSHPFRRPRDQEKRRALGTRMIK